MILSLVIFVIEAILFTCALIIRKRLRSAFEEEMDIGEPTYLYNPLEAGRLPLWQAKGRFRYEWPTDKVYSFLLDFLYPLHAEYARVSKSGEAIKIERKLNTLSRVILIWAFVLIITFLIVLVDHQIISVASSTE
ncbi:MAG: hypothetical protein HEP71_24425 [Roseivirga sp.]|nr:hypothetical protein [Roseivirga sp.]